MKEIAANRRSNHGLGSTNLRSTSILRRHSLHATKRTKQSLPEVYIRKTITYNTHGFWDG